MAEHIASGGDQSEPGSASCADGRWPGVARRPGVSRAKVAVHVRVVPAQYRTIRAAVSASQPGDEVRVLSGTYREQITIDKNLRLTGAGPGLTTIRAPRTLEPGEDGGRSIIEVREGATVGISRLAVSGPNAGSCATGPIEAGINVLDGGHLDLGLLASFMSMTRRSHAAVTTAWASW